VNRIYHPWYMWEETFTSMWRKCPVDRGEMLQAAIEFTGDAEKYGAAMMRVVEEWRYSCEHNLTDLSQNRKAWIGHAACALEKDFCEDIVRKAWGFLTDEQRDAANRKAAEAIARWESEQCQNEG
jgi:hypothetical protein